MSFTTITQEIMPFMQSYGLLVIFLGILLEGEITIIIAGILCQRGTLLLSETLFVAFIAAFVSDQIWFHFGRRYGQYFLNKFPSILKYQHKIQPWIQDKRDYIAFAERFIYGTRIIGYLLLGMHGYSVKRFMLIDSFVAANWCVLGVSLGYFLGTSADSIFGEIRYIEKLLLLIVAVGIAWHWYKDRKENDRLKLQAYLKHQDK